MPIIVNSSFLVCLSCSYSLPNGQDNSLILHYMGKPYYIQTEEALNLELSLVNFLF